MSDWKASRPTRTTGDDGESSRRVTYIDTWRLIAVSLVIVSHYLGNNAFVQAALPSLHDDINAFGPLGVYVFFVISGFVICIGLKREQTRFETVSLAGFYLRRILRIFPPLLLYLAALAVLTATGIVEVASMELLKSGSFLCNLPLTVECSWYTAHTWSLAYEEQFYLTFPLALVAFRLVRAPSLLVAFAMIVGVAAIVLRTTAMHHFFADYLAYVLYLLMGCIAALYWDGLRPLVARVPAWLWGMAVAVLVVMTVVHVHVGTSFKMFGLVAFPLLVAFVVLATPIGHPVVRSLFENRFASYLGKTSYSIYLWQQLVVRELPSQSTLWTPGLIALVFVLAHFSYRYLEKPLMERARRLSARDERRPSPDGSSHVPDSANEPMVPAAIGFGYRT